MDDESTRRRADAPIMESASGTTDPDNQNSGPGAYIIVALVLGVLLILTASLSSCTSRLSRYSSPLSVTDGYGHLDWDDTLDDNMDMLEEYFEDLLTDTHLVSGWHS